MRRLWVICACLVLCAVALAACGGGDGDDANAEAEAPALTAKERAAIEKAVADRMVDDDFEVTAVKVGKIEPSGGQKAVADTELTGGAMEGQTVGVEVIDVGGDWRFFEVKDFVDLDEPLLLKTVEAELKRPKEGLSDSQVRCLMGQFAKASQDQLEEMYLENSQQAFIELGKPCRKA